MSRTAKRIGREKAIARAKKNAALVAQQQAALDGLWSMVQSMGARQSVASFERTGATNSGAARPIERRPNYNNVTDSPLRNLSHDSTETKSLMLQALPIT
jgi:hypothetical protein